MRTTQYFDCNHNERIRSAVLFDLRGFPRDEAILRKLGIFPIREALPAYDEWRQKLKPFDDLMFDETAQEYVLRHEVVPLNAVELSIQLERYKARKLEALTAAFLDAEANGVVEISEGFAIDANERANRDLEGLITSMEAAGTDTVTFCAADNSFHDVTLDELKAMRLAVIARGQALYARKWELRSRIEAAESVEAVDAVAITFADV